MASTTVGSIKYVLELDTTKFKAGIIGAKTSLSGLSDDLKAPESSIKSFSETTSKSVSDAAKNIGNNTSMFSGAFDKIVDLAKKAGVAIGVGLGAGAVGLGAMVVQSLKANAQLEQQIGGSEAVFENFASIVQEKSKTAFRTAGLSQNEFLQGANKMGSLFQGAGFDAQQSLDMTISSMNRASDVASIMGISTESALESITGMAKGNFTMMDNLGVKMDETSIAAYAMSKGIGSGTRELTIQEKIGAATQMFLEQTAKYAGNYAKENDTLAGSINTTTKAFKDFMAGGDIGNFIDSAIHTIEIAIPRIIEILPKLVTGIGKILESLLPAISSALPVLIPAFVDALVGVMNAIVAAFPVIISALLQAMPLLINAFIEIFMAILLALPEIITMISEALPTIIEALVTGLTNPSALQAIIMGFVQLFIAFIEALPLIINAIVPMLPVILDNIIAVLTSPSFQEQMSQATLQLFSAMLRAMPEVNMLMIEALIDIAGSITKYLVSMGADLGQKFRTAIGGLSRILVDAGVGIMGGLLEGIKEGWKSVSSFVGGIGDKIKNLKGPLPKDKIMLIEEGQAIMDGLNRGIGEGFLRVRTTIKGITSELGATSFDNLDVGYNVAGGSPFSSPGGNRPSSSSISNITNKKQIIVVASIPGMTFSQESLREFASKLDRAKLEGESAIL